MYKFGSLRNSDDMEYHYDNIYYLQKYPTWSRLAIGASAEQIPLMLELAKSWQGPFGVLYVLVESRLDNKLGRYQIPNPCSGDELELYAYTFQEYFEKDGRHNVWFMDVSSGSQLVYDNHNILYAYGNHDKYCKILEANGVSCREFSIPAPHCHHYNQELDKYEEEVLNYWDWKWFPLHEEHDDP